MFTWAWLKHFAVNNTDIDVWHCGGEGVTCGSDITKCYHLKDTNTVLAAKANLVKNNPILTFIHFGKGPVIIYGEWWHRKEKFFLVKSFADPTIKKSKKFSPNLKYQLKHKYPPLAKNFTKGYHSVVTHVLHYFCDMSLITACAIFCRLKFHVVCTCTFGCLLTNRKMIKIVTLIDLDIALT